MNRYTLAMAKSLYALTPEHLLVEGMRRRSRGLAEDRIALTQRESENLDREFATVINTYGSDHFDLVLAIGYVGHLLGSAWVMGNMAQHHPAILWEFQKLVEYRQAA